jgi:hypothetical protein
MALDDNGGRLKAILEGFDIPISAVAEVSGISRAYVSRVLSPNDPLTGNDPFWLKVEKALGRLVDSRRGQVFRIGAMPVEKVGGIGELKKG